MAPPREFSFVQPIASKFLSPVILSFFVTSPPPVVDFPLTHIFKDDIREEFMRRVELCRSIHPQAAGLVIRANACHGVSQECLRFVLLGYSRDFFSYVQMVLLTI